MASRPTIYANLEKMTRERDYATHSINSLNDRDFIAAMNADARSGGYLKNSIISARVREENITSTYPCRVTSKEINTLLKFGDKGKIVEYLQCLDDESLRKAALDKPIKGIINESPCLSCRYASIATDAALGLLTTFRVSDIEPIEFSLEDE